MVNHNNLIDVTQCQYDGCQSNIGTDYDLEDLEEITPILLISDSIMVCPVCYTEIYEETHDSDYSDMHPNDTVDDFVDTQNYDD